MRRIHVVCSLIGSSAALLGIYFYLRWKRRKGTQIKTYKLPYPELASRVDSIDGLVENDDIDSKLARDTRAKEHLPSSHQRKCEDTLGESESFASTFTSLTSCEDDSSNNEKGKSDSCDTFTSSESERSIAGAGGVSTYKKLELEDSLDISSELDELPGSPIVTELYSDPRYQRQVPEGASNSMLVSENVVVEYEGPLTPINVNENIQNVSDTYNTIVLPLQPNTGTVVPIASVKPLFVNSNDC